MELEHHHDYIKKCFKKGMEEANMQGYVYGIILHDNKVLSGSSESLRIWCDQTIVFEHVVWLTGPPDGPLAPSQPNVSIPQASELQQSASHEVQIPPASAEPNQFTTGNSDLGPDSSFFQ
ncbi:hypothetical protein FCM35_KLT07395 [Carex littledalei]|uniref:Ethylene insensitive 3-like DNA-binding domain-containing protein n=1 Tax=Carex littledalei TaxID=544730 RepID=A0A833QTP2_9POAL|nr:hypothetical protein FCM35_KLT07395 [Carex littledalei]